MSLSIENSISNLNIISTEKPDRRESFVEALKNRWTNRWVKAGAAALIGTVFAGLGAFYYLYNRKKDESSLSLPTNLPTPLNLVPIQKGWHLDPQNPDLSFLTNPLVCLPQDAPIEVPVLPQEFTPVELEIEFKNLELIKEMSKLQEKIKETFQPIIEAKNSTEAKNSSVNNAINLNIPANSEIKPEPRKFFITGKSKILNFPSDVWNNPIPFGMWAGMNYAFFKFLRKNEIA